MKESDLLPQLIADSPVIVVLAPASTPDPSADDDSSPYITEQIVSDWLQLVWFAHLNNSSSLDDDDEPSLLVADCDQAHTGTAVQNTVTRYGNCTSLV